MKFNTTLKVFFSSNEEHDCLLYKFARYTVSPLIPLFHTGHESPGIDFFLIRLGGGFVRFPYFFFSNRDVLRVSPDSDTMSLRIFGGIGSIRLESHKNSLRLAK